MSDLDQIELVSSLPLNLVSEVHLLPLSSVELTEDSHPCLPLGVGKDLHLSLADVLVSLDVVGLPLEVGVSAEAVLSEHVLVQELPLLVGEVSLSLVSLLDKLLSVDLDLFL